MVKRINLALQGGGAHGAFTWGVLDRILEDERIEIAGISGTSAGAMNGAALKAGMVRDGRQGARENLNSFWQQVGAIKDDALAAWMDQVAPASPILAQAMMYSPAFAAYDVATRFFSPYSAGHLYVNPLKPVVEAFHFDEVCSPEGPELHVCATNVRTGKIKLFSGAEVTGEALMASACLPTMFQAVEIDGEAYWDGGYMGNPSLFPLIYSDAPKDILLVMLNPLSRAGVPKTASAIQERLNEINFNSSLLGELRAIGFVQKLFDDNMLSESARGEYRRLYLHIIRGGAAMCDLKLETKYDTDMAFLQNLRQRGADLADDWLMGCVKHVGIKSGVDIQAEFLTPGEL